MEKFTENTLTQEDYDPVNVLLLKDYLTKSFGDTLNIISSGSKILFVDDFCKEFLGFILTKRFLEDRQTRIFGISKADDFFDSMEDNILPNDTIVFVIQPVKDVFDDVFKYYTQFISKNILKTMLFSFYLKYHMK